MLDISLDWNYNTFFQPLYTPLWANASQIGGAVPACWFLYPILYFSNVLDGLNYLPCRREHSISLAKEVQHQLHPHSRLHAGSGGHGQLLTAPLGATSSCQYVFLIRPAVSGERASVALFECQPRVLKF